MIIYHSPKLIIISILYWQYFRLYLSKLMDFEFTPLLTIRNSYKLFSFFASVIHFKIYRAPYEYPNLIFKIT